MLGLGSLSVREVIYHFLITVADTIANGRVVLFGQTIGKPSAQHMR